MGRMCRALGTRCASPLWPRAAARLSRLRDRRPRELALQRGGAVQCRAAGWRRAPRAGHGVSTMLVAVCGNGRPHAHRAEATAQGGTASRVGEHRGHIAVAGPPCRLQIAPDKPPDRFSYGQQILAYGIYEPPGGPNRHWHARIDTRASPRPADAQTASWHAHTCSLYHHHELILPTICLKVSGPHWHAILDASKEVPEKIFHSNPFCRRM